MTNRKNAFSLNGSTIPNRLERVLLCLLIISASVAAAQKNQLALPSLAATPPMGWASWNYYFCDYNEQTIRDQADALVSTGMRDLGYRYLIIQECIAPERDASGKIVPDAKRFPHGIPALVEYIHARGLKAGIYTDVGPYTCFSKTHYEGSYDHEVQDAKTFAEWGIDLIEVDFCNKPKDHSGKELYSRMAEGIRKSGRPMLLYVCSWGDEQPWEWAPGMGQLWRTTEDISYEANRVAWTSVVRNFEANALHAAFTAPNSWNDPDMLEIGNRGLTPEESRSHISMWAISAAPLWAGTDLSHMDLETRAIYTNPEVIAVDQDPLGAGLRRVKESKGIEVWAKPLGRWSGGSQAVLLLNLNSSPANAEVRWSQLGLASNAEARDLWSRKNLGEFPDAFSGEIPSHGSIFLKVSGKSLAGSKVFYEAEWPGNLRSDGANLVQCGTCSGGYAVSLKASGMASAAGLVFPQIDAVAPENYQLSIVYLESSAQTLSVIVDGVPTDFNVPQKSGITSKQVRLQAGLNRVEVKSSAPIKIDCLTVSR